MPSPRVVLLTPSHSSALTQLPSCQRPTPLNPLTATLRKLPASVANKRFAEGLSPVDATLTKIRGEGSCRAPRPCIAPIPLPTKSTVPLSFQPLTNCPFPIPFVLTFIHVMGGMAPSQPATFKPSNLPTFQPSNPASVLPLSRNEQTATHSLLYMLPMLSSPLCLWGIALSRRLGGCHE